MAKRDDGDAGRESRLDAVIDEEARALLSVDASAGFDARVMSALPASSREGGWWAMPRLALAAGTLAVVLAAAGTVLWWAVAPGRDPWSSSWAARSGAQGPRVGGQATDASTPAATSASAGGAAAPAPVVGAPRRPPGRPTPEGGRAALETDPQSEGPTGVTVSALGLPEPLRVPSLQVDAVTIDAVQVTSLGPDRDGAEKKQAPAAGPEKQKE